MNTAKMLLSVFQYLHGQQNSEQKNEDDVVIETQEISAEVLDQMSRVVEQCMAILTQKSLNGLVFETTFGQTQTAFGSGKLKLLEIVLFSFKINFQKETDFFTSHSLDSLLQYMVSYTFNNFVQSGVYKILLSILEGGNQRLRVIVNM